MRYVVSVLGVILSFFLVLVSGAMNWRFGMSLGHTEIDAKIYGTASVAADGLKVLLPFFLYWAWRNARPLVASIGLAVWLVATVYSITSALGFAALNRAAVAGRLATTSISYDYWRADLMRNRAHLAELPRHRPPTVVIKKLDALRQDRRWSSTRQCSDATLPKSRAFCVAYNELQAELATGRQAAKLESKIENLREKLAAASSAANLKRGDPQASLIADIMHIDISKIQTGLIILIATLVELGSALGMFLATSHGELRRVTRSLCSNDLPRSDDSSLRPQGDIAKFALAKLEQAPGSNLDIAALFYAYCTWCEAENLQPIDLAAFIVSFNQLSQLVGFKNEVRDDVVTCLDIALVA